ncbi:MAG: hypothetical protein OXN17_12975 [Candidatus Poribacteria bacterium]|nr:hypothetical protein [Candidatus Poribacteria bacterium]MDE0506219.1 hypothetical protein [Candidatus Poribacteria bacterium]
MRIFVELVIRWIHLVAAIVWLGGILFSVSIAAPALRKCFPVAESIRHTTAIRNRLRHIIRFTIHILLITGAMNAFLVGLNTQMNFPRSYFIDFVAKLAFVGLMTLFHALHIAVFNRRLETAATDPNVDALRIARLQRLTNGFGILAMFAGVIVLVLSLRLNAG